MISTRRSRAGGRLRWFGVVAAVTVLVLTTPASAQRTQDAASAVTVDVRMNRFWFAPDVPLSFEVVVRNAGSERLEDLRLSVALYERVRARSALQLAFDGRLPRTPLDAFTVTLDGIDPGDDLRVGIDRPLTELDGFQGAPDGLYPLAMTVRRSTGPALAEAVTAVSLVAQPPEHPLRVVPVVTVFPRPLFDPDGSVPAASGRALRELTDAIARVPGTASPFALAVSPLGVDELARASRRESQVDDEVRRLAASALAGLVGLAARTEPLALPYALAMLPHMPAVDEGVDDQLHEGRRTLDGVLGRSSRQTLYPPALALDERSLERVADAGFDVVLAPGTDVLRTQLTPALAVDVGGVTLLPVDTAVSQRAADADDGLDLSRLMAELAMVYFESPGRERILAVTMPLTAERSGRLIARLAEAPWLQPSAPSAALANAISSRSVSFGAVGGPPSSYRRALDRARRAVARFDSFVLADNQLMPRFTAAVQHAASTVRWSDDWSGGRDWANAIAEAVDAQLARVDATTTTVTLTSRQGEVPVTVVNGTDYPVRVRVAVSSPKLEFPEGSERVLENVPPPGTTVTFPAVAASSGTFPMEVTVTSADGSVVVSTEELTVRSTALNVLALGLTLGAALFLVAWYGRRFVARSPA